MKTTRERHSAKFNRWSHRGFWLKLLDALVGAGAVTKSTETVEKRLLAKGLEA